jgi:signal peptidase I
MPDLYNTPSTEPGDGDMPSPVSDHPSEPLELADPATLADEDAVRASQSRETLSFGRWVLELVLLVALAWVLALGVKTYVVQPFIIPSASMEPTLLVSDRVLVNKFVYRFSSPKPGDIVVFVSPEDGRTDLIKRVIAVAGQTVDIRGGIVSVDGVPLTEPYVSSAYPDRYDSDATITVPPSAIWVMGDNRPNSKDSRFIGPQPLSSVVGRAFAIYWPLDRLTWF